MRERALAVGIFNSGTALGSALATPIVAAIALAFGWRYAFVATGLAGFVWIAVWLQLYWPPQEHARLSAAERALVLEEPPQEGGTSAPPVTSDRAPDPVSIATLLTMRAAWGCILARLLTDPISYFLAFWTPKYLQDERGFSLADLGRYGWIPFAALALGNIAGGAIPRVLVGRGWTVNRARKSTMLAVSLSMPGLCYFVTAVDQAWMAVALMAAIMFGHAAWANITLPAEVFPKQVVGTVTGLGGAFGALAGAITQLTIGWVVQHVSFTPVFAVCSVMYLVALAAVHLLIGELGVIQDPAGLKPGARSRRAT
jgi:ACS family hexuronate transporter-like MFS transporter